VAKKTLLYPFRQLSKAPPPQPPAKKKLKIKKLFLKKKHGEFSQDDNGPTLINCTRWIRQWATWEWWDMEIGQGQLYGHDSLGIAADAWAGPPRSSAARPLAPWPLLTTKQSGHGGTVVRCCGFHLTSRCAAFIR